MKFRPGNAQHIGSRDEQQDAFAFSDADDLAFVDHGGVLAVVADGMGGLDDGRTAATTAVRAFLEEYCAKPREAEIPATLARALQRANSAVTRLMAGGAPTRGGTTLAAAVLHEQGLYWIAAGDSRVYLLRSRVAEQVTVDHTYGFELDGKVARGELSAREAQADPERNALISYLGQPELTQIDCSLTAVPLRPDDLVLVCSDGLYRALSDWDIGEYAIANRDPQATCEALVAAALGKRVTLQDNCTVLAVSARLISERRTTERPTLGVS